MGSPELERASARGMEPGRPWARSPEILLLGGLVAPGTASEVAVAAAREAEDCWRVGEALRGLGGGHCVDRIPLARASLRVLCNHV